MAQQARLQSLYDTYLSNLRIAQNQTNWDLDDMGNRLKLKYDTREWSEQTKKDIDEGIR